MARSRRTPAMLCWQMLFPAFRPQTTRKLKKSQPPTGAQRSGEPAPSGVEWGGAVLSNSQWIHMEAEAPPSVIPPAPAVGAKPRACPERSRRGSGVQWICSGNVSRPGKAALFGTIKEGETANVQQFGRIE